MARGRAEAYFKIQKVKLPIFFKQSTHTSPAGGKGVQAVCIPTVITHMAQSLYYHLGMKVKKV